MTQAAVNAVQELLIRHSELLRGCIFSLLGRHDDTDDVFQEVFLTATAKADEFAPGSNFLAWARAIARYRVLRHVSDVGRRPLLNPEVVAALASDDDQQLDPERFQAERVALRRCLQHLTPAARAILEQRYLNDCGPQAIAKHLGRSVNGVSVALAKARNVLRRCMQARLARMPDS